MRRKITILTAVLVLLQLSVSLWALPTTAYEAEMVVRGWLKADPQPLETPLGREVMRIETFTDEYDVPLYYIVYLEPSGFVIVPADDLIEPIVGFADGGTYDPSLDTPLGALVNNDLNGRMAAIHNTFSLQALVGEASFTDTQKKWSFFISLAEASEGEFNLMGRLSISDVRVAPLVQSEWSQGQVCDKDCYNYYTPNNYPSGCVATAMAQLMRYYKYPNEPDDSVPNSLSIFGRRSFTIIVDGKDETRYLKGGDGSGGPYKWGQMVLEPGCSTTLTQRQAIGALCYDAGISVNMQYTEGGSSSDLMTAVEALKSVFKYSNGIGTFNYDYGRKINLNIGSGLIGMINPNLDAEKPVIIGIFGKNTRDDSDAGHAVVCDGYGYHTSSLYHHLNMGFSGQANCWYILPDIDCTDCSDQPYKYTVVSDCAYNIFTTGSGEIISGRVTDADGRPISEATVTATGLGRSNTHTDTTDSKGIYALAKVNSQSTYTLSVTKSGYSFPSQDVHTGKSENGELVSGNRWGVNVQEEEEEPPPPSKLVAWWKLDEGSGVIAADSSGNGHDGTAQTTPEWVNGPNGYGKALYFDGSDPAPAWVNCGTWNPSAGTGQLTVALWIWWDGAVPGVWQGVIAKRDGGGSGGARMMWDIMIHRDNHKIRFSRVGSYPSCGGRVLPERQWSHVAATFDGTTMIFYINGEETGRGNFSFGSKTNSTIIIGGLNKGGGGGFNGALDDIRLYNNALSPAEIKSLAPPQPNQTTFRPVSATQCPAVNTQCPVELTKCPTNFTSCPRQSTLCGLGINTQCPPLGTKCPPINTRCPSVNTQCPVESTKCPTNLTSCPPQPTICLTIVTECPSSNTQCPPSDTECPPINTRCPPSDTECPVWYTLCPPSATLCKTIDTECPAWNTWCPPEETECPTVDTQCPVESTKCPIDVTFCPRLPTMCVFFDTECPLATFCPTDDTRCPPVSTRCPVRTTTCVDTLCPPISTRCPRIWPCNSGGTENFVGEMRYSWSVGPCPAIEVPCPSVVPRDMLTETRQPVVQNIARKTELED